MIRGLLTRVMEVGNGFDVKILSQFAACIEAVTEQSKRRLCFSFISLPASPRARQKRSMRCVPAGSPGPFPFACR